MMGENSPWHISEDDDDELATKPNTKGPAAQKVATGSPSNSRMIGEDSPCGLRNLAKVRMMGENSPWHIFDDDDNELTTKLNTKRRDTHKVAKGLRSKGRMMGENSPWGFEDEDEYESEEQLK